MANAENLIPNSQRTPSELREITKKGGIASGISRANKATFRDITLKVLDGKIKSENKSIKKIKEELKSNGFKEKDQSYKVALVLRHREMR